MSTLKFFEYNGFVGATTDIENGVFLNDLKSSGQMGCVVHTNFVVMSEAAKKLIMNANREGGSFSNLMLTRHADNSGASVGVLGFYNHFISNSNRTISIGRDCDKSILDSIKVEDVEAPDDFKEFIDSEFPS